MLLSHTLAMSIFYSFKFQVPGYKFSRQVDYCFIFIDTRVHTTLTTSVDTNTTQKPFIMLHYSTEKKL